MDFALNEERGVGLDPTRDGASVREAVETLHSIRERFNKNPSGETTLAVLLLAILVEEHVHDRDRASFRERTPDMLRVLGANYRRELTTLRGRATH